MATFSDIDRRFAPSDNGDIKVRTNEGALGDAIRNILLTEQGERFMQPNFGSQLREAIGRQMDDQTKQWVKLQVNQALAQEERIDVEDINVEFFKDKHSIKVTVFWSTPIKFSLQETVVEVS